MTSAALRRHDYSYSDYLSLVVMVGGSGQKLELESIGIRLDIDALYDAALGPNEPATPPN